MNKESVMAFLSSQTWLIEEKWMKSLLTALQSADPQAFFDDNSETNNRSSLKIQDGIGIVSMSGPIFPEPNILTEFLGIGVALSDVMEDLRTARDSDEVRETLIIADSPGGVVTGIDECAAFIKNASKIKPINVYGKGMVASAMYWLASSASSITVSSTSPVGSIGVVATVRKPQDDDYYIEITNTASPNKRVDPSTEEGRKVITDHVDALADVFMSTVAENRGVSVETVKNDFGKGGLLIGAQALSVGMVDRVGTMEDLIKEKTNLEGETDMKLTLASLKADHSDVFDQVVAEVTQSVTEKFQGDISALKDSITEKDSQITGLTNDLTAATEEKDALGGRVLALEKESIINKEASNRERSESIFSSCLDKSNVPVNLHAKVKKHVDYSAFVKDGVLDTDAFSAAVTAEIADWETKITSEPSVQGFSIVPDDDDKSGAADETVSRLLKYVN